MATCPHCGANINDHYKYCPRCGTAQPEKHTGVTEIINGIQAELDRRMAREELKVSREIDLSSWREEAEKVEAEPAPLPEPLQEPLPDPIPEPFAEPVSQPEPEEDSWASPDPLPYRQPDVSGLYEGYQTEYRRPEPEEDEEELHYGSRLLGGLILLVSGLLIVAVAFGIMLILHPISPAGEEPASIAEEEPSPAPTAEPTPEPAPEPTPEPEPEEPGRGETEQLIYDVLETYYASYLAAINQQNVDLLEATSQRNQEAAAERILSGPNAENLYAEDDFQVEVDMETFQLLPDNSIQVNAHMVFYGAPRSGGNSQTVNSWQTIQLIQGTGEDGWIVDRTEYLSQDGYINHQYAFLPQ